MEFLRRRRGGAERRNLGALPKWPVPGDSYALETRPSCVRSFRRICDSPVTETVQLRGETEREFKLDRKDYLGGKTNQSIRRVTEDNRERPEIVFLGSNAGDRPAPILKSCFHCHQGGDLNVRTQTFSLSVGPLRARPRLVESTVDDEVAKGIHWKYDQFMWGKLQGLWEGQTPR
jgi:hypothetical protein